MQINIGKYQTLPKYLILFRMRVEDFERRIKYRWANDMKRTLIYPAVACSKLTIETEQGVKYVQS